MRRSAVAAGGVIAHRSVVPNVPSGAAPGTVVRAGAAGIDITAGDGQVLRLLVLQLEGGRPLTARRVPGRPRAGRRRRVRAVVIAPARRAAFAVLRAVAGGRVDLGEALDHARRGIADPRDVALLHELAVGTVRWQSRLDAAIAQLSRVPLAKLDLDVLLTLRLGAYQLLYL